MSHKTKYFFVLILFCAMFGVVATTGAQTRDEVLVSKSGTTLRRSDIDKMLSFYEWAFEARFTPEQRSKFSEYTVLEFSSDPAKYRGTVDDIIGAFAKISNADKSSQERTRSNFLPEFLNELRNGQDENSQMLLSIYEASHSGSNSNVAKNNESDSSESPAGNISALAGTWVWGHSGSSTYSTGGAHMGSNGSRHTYKFMSDGSAEYTGIMNVMTGGCNMQVFRTMKGRASLNGTTLVINWAPGPFSRDDSCDRAGNYKKTMPAETETFQVRFKNDVGQRQLCLAGKSETCYSASN